MLLFFFVIPLIISLKVSFKANVVGQCGPIRITACHIIAQEVGLAPTGLSYLLFGSTISFIRYPFVVTLRFCICVFQRGFSVLALRILIFFVPSLRFELNPSRLPVGLFVLAFVPLIAQQGFFDQAIFSKFLFYFLGVIPTFLFNLAAESDSCKHFDTSRMVTKGFAWRVLSVVYVLIFIQPARADIFWDDCTSTSDHPGIATGDFYNLCLIDHIFKGENWSWKFTKAEIRGTKFVDCLFTNQPYAPNNFTEASWTNVEFDSCLFGTIDEYNKGIVFDRTGMTNVEFKNCVFDHSVHLLFSEFSMNNVSFTNCTFRGDTMFTLGEMTRVSVIDSRVRRSDVAEITSGEDSFTFRQVTMNGFQVLGSDFVPPLRFEGVNGAKVAVNETTINKLWCHSPPDAEKENRIEFPSIFNDSIMDTVSFDEAVKCDTTTWRNLFMANITFFSDADFSKSRFEPVTWDTVKMVSRTRDCHTLNFTYSQLLGRIFANTSVDCHADFESSYFEYVYVRNFYAAQPNFQNALFNQEYIDGQCCSVACAPLGCMCNVTLPSGNCPAGRSNVNVSAVEESCFPASASVMSANGVVVRMEDLEFRDRVTIGNGATSDIYFFGHRDPEVVSNFISITHSGSVKPLRLSPSHYLYVNGNLQTAETVQRGDELRAADGADKLVVKEVRVEKHRGLYAPTSIHGDLVVDGVTVSSYTSAVHPRVSHTLLYPLRTLYRNGLHSIVERFSVFERRSWATVARSIGFTRGPPVVRIM